MSGGSPRRPRVRRLPPGGVLASLVVIGLFLFAVKAILLPFVVAVAIAYAAKPGIDRLQARTGWPRWVPAMIVFVLVVGVVGTVGWLAAPGLISEAKSVLTDFEGTLERGITAVLGGGEISILGLDMTAQELAQRGVKATHDWLGQVGRLTQLAALGFGGFFGVILTVVLLAYFLVGLPGLAAGMLKLVPPAQRATVAFAWSRVDPVLSRYFIGLGVVVVYASIAAYLGLGLVLHLPHAVLLAILTGFLELIPVVGPATSAVLAGLVALQSATSFWSIGAYVVYATLLRISIDQFIGPLVLGRAAFVPPVLVIFCFLSGGVLFGIAGVILAVPTALTIRIVVATLYGEGGDFDDEQEGSEG